MIKQNVITIAAIIISSYIELSVGHTYIFGHDLLRVRFTNGHVLSDGEMSDSELLNLSQLTEDSIMNNVNNIEHGHDSGIVDGV